MGKSALDGFPPAPHPDARALTGGMPGAMPGAMPSQTGPMPPQVGSGPMPQGPQGPQGMGQAPAPSHGEVVAALRHFHAIESELTELLRNPAAGKSNIKSAIIDGTTKLVAQRIMSPAQAVSQLGDVPDTPFQQRAWLQQHLEAIKTARVAVLQHHQQHFSQVPEQAVDTRSAGPDGHMDAMSSLTSRYRQ